MSDLVLIDMSVKLALLPGDGGAWLAAHALDPVQGEAITAFEEKRRSRFIGT